ncbi:MAG: PIN domain-containing protein [Candidatus Kapabacteria bacterium]|nr:PIN domain-containing protein [Ignavibacteriota bacterium]MCW5885006.1 PIN domain-containing protein [Candidatus Kapabacteria bacterium]
MQVLVDTSVWSIVFRKKKLSEIEQIVSMELRQLIDTGAVEIIGAIRQEILLGITSNDIFLSLKIAMQKFKDLDLNTEIYEKAAENYNICRKNGIQGSHIDFLICATSTFYQIPIFTLDKDFDLYKRYLPISLYIVKSSQN